MSGSYEQTLSRVRALSEHRLQREPGLPGRRAMPYVPPECRVLAHAELSLEDIAALAWCHRNGAAVRAGGNEPGAGHDGARGRRLETRNFKLETF